MLQFNSTTKAKTLINEKKLAIGTWRTTYDPSVYGSMSLRMDKTLEYLEEFRQKKNRRLTLSHILAKVMGMVLHEMPDANAILRFNRIYLREDIGVFSSSYGRSANGGVGFIRNGNTRST